MTAVQHRHRKQVQYAQTEADQRQHGKKRHESGAGGLSGKLGNGDRPAEIIQRRLAYQHPAQHPQGQQRHIPSLADGRPDRIQRPIPYHDLQVVDEINRDIRSRLDKTDSLALLVFPTVGSQLQRLLDLIAFNPHGEGLAGMPFDKASPLPPVRHRFVARPNNAISGLQTSPLRRAVMLNRPDHCWQYRL